jgi:hypothetical protein
MTGRAEELNAEAEALNAEIDAYFASQPKKEAVKMMPVPSLETLKALRDVVHGEPLTAKMVELIQDIYLNLLIDED